MKDNSQLNSTDRVSKTLSNFSSSQSHPKESLNLVIDLEGSKIEDPDRTITESDSDDKIAESCMKNSSYQRKIGRAHV